MVIGLDYLGPEHTSVRSCKNDQDSARNIRLLRYVTGQMDVFTEVLQEIGLANAR